MRSGVSRRVATGTVPIHFMIRKLRPRVPILETLRFATLLRIEWKRPRTNIQKLSDEVSE